MHLGEELKKYRKKQNLSEMDLAMLLRISRKDFVQLEAGRLLPSEAVLHTLSELLQIPRAELLAENEPLPIPFHYGKAVNVLPFLVAVVLPALFIISAPLAGSLENVLLQMLIGFFLLFLFPAMGFYDFKRYYSYFTVEEKGFTIYDESRKLPYPFEIVLSLFGQRSTRFIPYSEITMASIYFDSGGYKGSKNGINYRPRQMYFAREIFQCELTLKDKTVADLDLSRAYFPESEERKYFCSVFFYLAEQGVTVSDPKKIIEAVQRKESIIEAGYRDDSE